MMGSMAFRKGHHYELIGHALSLLEGQTSEGELHLPLSHKTFRTFIPHSTWRYPAAMRVEICEVHQWMLEPGARAKVTRPSARARSTVRKGPTLLLDFRAATQFKLGLAMWEVM